MQFETTVEIDVPAEAVWSALVDVPRWPEWTESMQDVRWLDDGGIRVGARARVKQPGMPPLTWTVTALDPGREFDWEASSPGVKTIGGHTVGSSGAQASTLTLSLTQSGVLARLVGALTGARTRKYVQMEANGLKRAAESEFSGRTDTVRPAAA